MAHHAGRRAWPARPGRAAARAVIACLLSVSCTNKTFWRIARAVNTLGSAGYWLFGRRYRRPQPR